MTTQTKDRLPKDGTNSCGARSNTRIPPTRKMFEIGVSLRNVLYQTPTERDTEKSWFVYRVAYGKSLYAYNLLNSEGLVTYMPVHYVMKRKKPEDKGKRVLEPMISNLVFVYSELKEVKKYLFNSNDEKSNPYIHLYYDQTGINESGYNSPVTIPFDVMSNFIRLTTIDDKFIEFINPNDCKTIDLGKRVRIVRGKFTGITGHVARYHRQSCVVINVEHIGWLRTAHVSINDVIEIPE